MSLSIGELVGYVSLNTAGVSKGVATTQAQMVGLGKSMDTAGSRAQSGFSKIGGAIKTVGLTTGALGFAAAIKGSIGLEASFSKTMAQIAASTGAPKAEMGKLQALAMKLGADTSFSAGEASGAMLELAKAGISTSDIMGGALSGTLTLAAAGGTDLATASTIASNAMNTFGLKGKDMSSIAAALAGGANASSASVESLGEALSQVGPGATNAGLSLQDTVGVLSAFDAAGIKGSDAGTSLKTMLTTLAPATSQAAQAMQRYGLMQYDATNAAKLMNSMGLKPQSNSLEDVSKALSDYYDAQGVAKEGTAGMAKAINAALMSNDAMHSSFVKTDGSFRNIAGVAGILQKKLGGLSESQRTQALTQIFGSDAARAATVLMKQGAEGIKGYVKQTKDQTAAQKMAKANMSGTAGAIERMKGSIETAGLALGQALAPATQDVAGLIAGLANKVGTATTFLQKHKGVAIGLGATIATLATLVLAYNTAQNISAAGGMVKYLMQGRLISAATKVWTAVQWALNAAMSANPMTLIAIGIAALVAAVVLIATKTTWFQDLWATAWGGIKGAASAVFGWVKNHWPLILGILTGPIGLAALAIAKHWDNIKDGAADVVAWVKGIPGKLATLGTMFGTAGRNLLQSFIDGMKNAAGIISGIAGNVWDTVKGLLNGAIDKINTALEFHINKGPIHLSVNPPDIPHLATGGRATGATIAEIGEGREPETVLPDSVLRGLLERVHESGRQQGADHSGGRNAPLIGQLINHNADPNLVAEQLWFKTRTRG